MVTHAYSSLKKILMHVRMSTCCNVSYFILNGFTHCLHRSVGDRGAFGLTSLAWGLTPGQPARGSVPAAVALLRNVCAVRPSVTPGPLLTPVLARVNVSARMTITLLVHGGKRYEWLWWHLFAHLFSRHLFCRSFLHRTCRIAETFEIINFQ